VTYVNRSRCMKCSKQASFGNPNKKARYCSQHKKSGMIDLLNSKCKDCTNYSSFGPPNGRREYCATHKKDGMILLKHRSNKRKIRHISNSDSSKNLTSCEPPVKKIKC
jgi:hypothetical protein